MGTIKDLLPTRVLATHLLRMLATLDLATAILGPQRGTLLRRILLRVEIELLEMAILMLAAGWEDLVGDRETIEIILRLRLVGLIGTEDRRSTLVGL